MRLALYCSALLVLLAIAVVARRGYRRWEVSGRSMTPALAPGDWLIVEPIRPNGRRPVRAGDIVLTGDPREQGRTLIKRVVRIEGRLAWLEGDNPAESTDSRQFGPVAVEEIAARVCWRYWPLRRAGRVT